MGQIPFVKYWHPKIHRSSSNLDSVYFKSLAALAPNNKTHGHPVRFALSLTIRGPLAQRSLAYWGRFGEGFYCFLILPDPETSVSTRSGLPE